MGKKIETLRNLQGILGFMKSMTGVNIWKETHLTTLAALSSVTQPGNLNMFYKTATLWVIIRPPKAALFGDFRKFFYSFEWQRKESYSRAITEDKTLSSKHLCL